MKKKNYISPSLFIGVMTNVLMVTASITADERDANPDMDMMSKPALWDYED